MARVGSLEAHVVVLALSSAAGGCSDQVVGFFDAPGLTGAEATGPSASSDAGLHGSSSGATTLGGSGDNGTGAGGFVPPGCFSDDFEDGVVDPDIWNTWAEEDSLFEEVAGWMKFTPPSYGVFDTGIIGNHLHVFPFEQASVRLEVTVPPPATRPVVLFLSVSEEPHVVSIRLAENTITIDATSDEVVLYRESFPAEPYPRWIGLRAEGSLVHFEVSDDGLAFTTLVTRDKPAPMAVAQPFVMAQTYGEDLERGIVAVDNFEACVQ